MTAWASCMRVFPRSSSSGGVSLGRLRLWVLGRSSAVLLVGALDRCGLNRGLVVRVGSVRLLPLRWVVCGSGGGRGGGLCEGLAVGEVCGMLVVECGESEVGGVVGWGVAASVSEILAHGELCGVVRVLFSVGLRILTLGVSRRPSSRLLLGGGGVEVGGDDEVEGWSGGRSSARRMGVP